MNYLTIEEQPLHTTSQRFAMKQFADLEDQPCTATEDFLHHCAVGDPGCVADPCSHCLHGDLT